MPPRLHTILPLPRSLPFLFSTFCSTVLLNMPEISVPVPCDLITTIFLYVAFLHCSIHMDSLPSHRCLPPCYLLRSSVFILTTRCSLFTHHTTTHSFLFSSLPVNFTQYTFLCRSTGLSLTTHHHCHTAHFTTALPSTSPMDIGLPILVLLFSSLFRPFYSEGISFPCIFCHHYFHSWVLFLPTTCILPPYTPEFTITILLPTLPTHLLPLLHSTFLTCVSYHLVPTFFYYLPHCSTFYLRLL